MEFQHDGEKKFLFCKRLSESWRDLADALNISVQEQNTFPQGQEARRIWEWLECRDALPTLPERLEFIGRGDLAAALFTHHRLPDIKADWHQSPFPGLTHFTHEEAPIFFGRDAQANTLLERLRDGQRFIGVFGASGSGKSSLIWAGVIPRLKEIPGGEHWIWKRFTPAGHPDGPFAALAQALEQELAWQDRAVDEFADALYRRGRPELVVDLVLKDEPPEAELLLFIDQFEELYSTIAETQQKRFALFVHLLATTARLRVVLTVRADFYHYCVAQPKLAALLEDGAYPLAAPDLSSLHAMVTEPAAKAGIEFEDDLPARLLTDTGQDAPGRLALLAYALYQLYERDGAGRRLTVASYEAFGGVEGAIGQQAEAVFKRLSKPAQQAMGSVFRELVKVDDDGAATRRRAPLSSVTGEPAMAALVKAFCAADARLLTSDDGGEVPVLEVAHEALFRSWKRLADWVELRKDDLRLVRQVRLAAAEWDERQRDEAYRWPHERLLPVYAMRERLAPELDAVVEAFVQPEAERLWARIEDPATTHQERAKIGDRLAEIGDKRFGIGVDGDGVPEIDWVEIPGGKVTLKGKASTFEVKSFYLARYPVTYRQYRAFLKAQDGFENDEWWEGLAERPGGPGAQYRAVDNHPAENVSWYDAMAFCRWLSRRLGYEVRLPTEWEWQQAATGGLKDREYPWGSEWDYSLCNFYEARLSRTIAVGLFPAGASPQGLLDLSGQVWEWCLNEHDKPKNITPGGDGRRVVRGGSWLNLQDRARAAYRDHNLPDDRDICQGFRVCCACPILKS